ncbi:Uncharacterised protein [Vibrio cholerae]|nr:Uncharacterised protein [Vibrio cholerae]
MKSADDIVNPFIQQFHRCGFITMYPTGDHHIFCRRVRLSWDHFQHATLMQL